MTNQVKEEEDINLKSINFPPDILAKIAPDVSLQKHLSIGLRPSLRKFEEFRSISASEFTENGGSGGEANKDNNILGSSIIRCGSTVIICGISAGIIEDQDALINDYRVKLDKDIIDSDVSGGADQDSDVNCSVYTVVEIMKGRSGPPSEEEIFLSQKIYEVLLHSGILKRKALEIELQMKTIDETTGDIVMIKNQVGDDDGIANEFMTKKKYSFVLYANVQVYSKTGPLFDLCYGSIIKALQNTYLPFVYIDEKQIDFNFKNLRGKNGNNNSGIEDNYKLICDPEIKSKLSIDTGKLSWSSSFGIVDIKPGFDNYNLDEEMGDESSGKMQVDVSSVGEQQRAVLLADLEGESEETAINKNINVICNGNTGIINGLTITGGGSGGSKITLEFIKKSIDLSMKRSKDLLNL
ncbi:unnamed protein product [[Candida] boidinii]|uniref:Ribosomal RNA-processing protein 43 n=1 Tax=Candida boidinii TaxID=5477 RepID=A0A9W6WD58_CANBO|nr:hypothetical protein B5S30_g2135 [[Candida] boidinii]GME66705.1 unnamed protein product [[Candida] boidinii]GMG20841.1 unnamed protein product [[Candida] boidinii]